MSATYDDPNRESVGLAPIWTGADTDPTDPVDPGEVVPEAEPETAKSKGKRSTDHKDD